jgi:hypothetical protein
MVEDITVEKIFGKGDIVKLFLQHYDTPDLEMKANNYANEVLNTNDFDEDEIVETEDFKKWLRNDLETEIYDLKWTFQNLLNGNGIAGWREMSVNKKWLENLRDGKIKTLGIYWSYEEEAAEPHWGYAEGKEDIYVRLKGILNVKDVNWIETFDANLYPSLGEDEKEIRMKEHGRIKLEEIKILGSDTDELEGKLIKLTPEILKKPYQA